MSRKKKLNRLVLGAERDFIVDEEGVIETANYLGECTNLTIDR
jgi:hypothetical protein